MFYFRSVTWRLLWQLPPPYSYIEQILTAELDDVELNTLIHWQRLGARMNQPRYIHWLKVSKDAFILVKIKCLFEK